jgi:hypothetical protein
MLDVGDHLLALDMASLTGYCVGAVGSKPRFGTWRLRDSEDHRKRAARNLGCRLRDEFSLQRPMKVFYEAAIATGAMLTKGNSSHSADLLWSLQGAVEGVCGPYGVFTQEANVTTVRKAVMGNGRPNNPKVAVVEFCRSIGFDVTDHNAADAIFVWLFAAGWKHNELDYRGAFKWARADKPVGIFAT